MLGRDFDVFLTILICAVIGVITSMIVRVLNDRNIVINEILRGTITITDVQVIIILLWIILGVFLGAIKR